ncbi:MAG: nucleotidyltransferase family protein [Blastocatellia bacterium]
MGSVQSTSADNILRAVDEFFMNAGPVHNTLRRLARRLAEERIDYAIIGGMALALHGFVRPTQDVDLLMTREGLERFSESLVGRGYVAAFPGARKHFRDSETGVPVEIITTGEYPGDGHPKAVAFPDPATVSVDKGDYSVVSLESLIELKLTSGLSAEHRRLRDLADVQQLIETLDLPRELAERLHPSIRDEYLHLWQLAHQARQDRSE